METREIQEGKIAVVYLRVMELLTEAPEWIHTVQMVCELLRQEL